MTLEALKRLATLQNAHKSKITLMSMWLRDEPINTLNKHIIQSRIDALHEISLKARTTHAEVLAREGAETDPYISDGVFMRVQGLFEDSLDQFLTLLTDFEAVGGAIFSVVFRDNSSLVTNGFLMTLSFFPHIRTKTRAIPQRKLIRMDLSKLSGCIGTHLMTSLTSESSERAIWQED